MNRQGLSVRAVANAGVLGGAPSAPGVSAFLSGASAGVAARPNTQEQPNHSGAVERQSSNPVADAAMDRYASDDALAFEPLYDALAPRLYAFAMQKVRDRSRAEDLVQQTFLHMHAARGRFVPGSRVTPWAFAILRRLYLDHARRRRVEALAVSEHPYVDSPSGWQGPEELTECRELKQLIRRSLAWLSPPQREAFELVHYGQLSHAEAAEALGVTVASIKLRLQRANQAIRAALSQLPAPEDHQP